MRRVVFLVVLMLFCTAVSGQTVRLQWDPNIETDLAGYNIYRGPSSTGPYSKRNTDLISGTQYEDFGLVSGEHYFYVATAVNAEGLESGYSNVVEYSYGFANLCLGDANQDGMITVADAVAISRYITGLGTLTPEGLAAADVNQDHQVSVADIVRIHRSLAGIDPLEPCP